MRRIILGAVAGLVALGAAQAAEFERGDPVALGFSPERLAALDAALQVKIDSGAFPGAIVTIVRGGEIAHLSTLGAQREGGGAMPEDAIFRIYSMTKPIASVAAMMLVEEGKLALEAPVSAYLPEFAEMTVLNDDGTEEPAKRPMTVQDLFRHTAGLTYGFFGAGPAREKLKEAMIANDRGLNNMAFAKTIASLPLEHHPGEVWEYSRATDILGAVIEKVEGEPLAEVLEARIFAPLDMKDTGFWVEDEAARARLAEAKADDMKIGPYDMYDPTRPQAFESAGGGLVSTTRDYARFLQMLLNEGELDGVRILSPKTVAFMTADHMGDRIAPGKYYLPGPGYGFGLGFGVRREEGVATSPGSVGDYSWGGAAGTYFWVDPEEEMFVIYMMQSPKSRLAMRPLLKNMVYGAFAGPEIAE